MLSPISWENVSQSGHSQAQKGKYKFPKIPISAQKFKCYHWLWPVLPFISWKWQAHFIIVEKFSANTYICELLI